MEVIGRSLAFAAAHIILSIKYFATMMIVKALPGAQRNGNPNGIHPMPDTN